MEEVQRHKNNPGSLWKIINQAIRSQGQDNLSYTKDPKTVANEFNQFFSSIGSNTADASIRLAEENITLEGSPLKTIHMPSEDLFSFRTENQRRSMPRYLISAIEQIPRTRQDKLSNPQRLSSRYTRTTNEHN